MDIFIIFIIIFSVLLALHVVIHICKDNFNTHKDVNMTADMIIENYSHIDYDLYLNNYWTKFEYDMNLLIDNKIRFTLSDDFDFIQVKEYKDDYIVVRVSNENYHKVGKYKIDYSQAEFDALKLINLMRLI